MVGTTTTCNVVDQLTPEDERLTVSAPERDTLFVLCPASVFGHTGPADELAANVEPATALLGSEVTPPPVGLAEILSVARPGVEPAEIDATVLTLPVLPVV